MTKSDSATPPTHVVDPDADRTRCGLRLRDPAALPVVGAAHVHRHLAARAIVVCERCAEAGALRAALDGLSPDARRRVAAAWAAGRLIAARGEDAP